MGVVARIPSIENVLSHFAAVVKRRVSGTFQAYFPLAATVRACSRLASPLGWSDQVWL